MEIQYPVNIIQKLHIAARLETRPVLLKLNESESLAFLESERTMIDSGDLKVSRQAFGPVRYYYKNIRVLLDHTLIGH